MFRATLGSLRTGENRMRHNVRGGAPVRTDQAQLDQLVESTRGLQPFRRLFHAAVGIALAALLWLVQPARTHLLAALGLLAVVLLAIDLVRLRVPGFNLFFFRTVRSLASPREARGIASSTWYVVGILVAAILYPLEAVVPAILVLAFADPAASYIGRRWGRHPVGTGTIEGVGVFVIVAGAVLLFAAPPATALAAAVAGGLIEITPWKLDDNLTIPLAVATVLWALPT